MEKGTWYFYTTPFSYSPKTAETHPIPLPLPLPLPLLLLIQTTWSWDLSSGGGSCKKESGTITVPPTTSKFGTRVAGCTDSNPQTYTLYCAVGVGGGGGAGGSGDDGATLTAHYTYTYAISGSGQADGPAVSSGCSTVIGYNGQPSPYLGKCCFA
jgi:hypothetical protein